MAAGYRDSSLSISRPRGRIQLHEKESLGIPVFLSGSVLTPNGIVDVLSRHRSAGSWSFEYTTLDMVVGGRWHMRFFERAYSAQYLVTLADRFAREVVARVF